MCLPLNRGWRYLLLLLLAIAILYFSYRVREVLYAFGFAALMAYVLYRPVQALEGKGLKRGWAILLLYSVSVLALALLLYGMVPTTAAELKKMALLYPQHAQKVQEPLEQLNGIPKPEQIQALIDNNSARIQAAIYQALQGFINTVYRLLSHILVLLFAPLLAFYILTDWEKIKTGFLNLLSPPASLQCLQLCQRIDNVLLRFISGYLAVAGVVGLLTGLLAFILGVPLPLLIGIIAGLTNLIPYFGPIIGGIPIVVLAGSVSWRLALYMAIGIVVVQQLDANLFTPKIIGERLGMHPLWVIFSLWAGGTLFGLWGLLLGVPAAAVLKVILQWCHLKVAG